MELTHCVRRMVAGLLMLVAVSAGGCASDTTIIFVRHAEKGPGQDPSLTPAGVQRAEALRDALAGSGVSAIFVTNFQRTQQTAAPTAQALGVTPIVTAIAGTAEAHAADVAAQVRSRSAGSRILVVGHSNTVPLIMQALGVSNPPSLAESEFDRLFVVMRRKNAATRVIEARYGE